MNNKSDMFYEIMRNSDLINIIFSHQKQFLINELLSLIQVRENCLHKFKLFCHYGLTLKKTNSNSPFDSGKQVKEEMKIFRKCLIHIEKFVTLKMFIKNIMDKNGNPIKPLIFNNNFIGKSKWSYGPTINSYNIMNYYILDLPYSQNQGFFEKLCKKYKLDNDLNLKNIKYMIKYDNKSNIKLIRKIKTSDKWYNC